MSVVAGQFLLDWQDDEIIFSLASRLHRLWGHPLAETTARILFGAAHGGTQHDLTTHLSVFSQNTEGLLGEAEALARERTLACYYQTFLPQTERDRLIEALCGTSLAHVKLRLGILTSRFRAHHPLKACPACMQADVKKEGSAVWHLRHQFPGVWICPEHGNLLLESLFKSSGVGRFQWFLPDVRLVRSVVAEESSQLELSIKALSQLTKTITELVRAAQNLPLDTELVWKCYRVALAERGWLTQGGNLRLKEAAASFADYARVLRVIPELAALPATVEEAQTQIGRLLRPLRSGTHPVRHFLLVDWLFGSADIFLSCYAQQEDQIHTSECIEPSASCSASAKVQEAPLQKVRQLLVNEGLSLREAATRLNVDVTTAMVWATRCDIEVSRRPKVLKPELRQALIEMLRQGVDKSGAATQCGIAVVSVTRVLRTEPGLQAVWHQVRFEQAQVRARQTWMDLISQHGELGVKYLRGLSPAIYAWLYRNDRAWLNSQIVAKMDRTTMRDSPVHWDERDQALSTQVANVALVLSKAQPGKRLHLWQLYQQVPELKAKLSALHRLPLTRRAIDRAIRDRIDQFDLLERR